MNIKYDDGQPCDHKGCLSHITHPCEGCGRIGGRGIIYGIQSDQIDFYMNNPLFEVVEAEVVNNAIEAECSLCIYDKISEYTGLSFCCRGTRPKIVWDEGRDRAIFYCEQYKLDQNILVRRIIK